MFSDSYLPYASGVVRSVETFSDGLRRGGDEVYIIAPAYPGYVDDDPNIFRSPSYRFSSHSDFRLAAPFNRELARKIIDLKLDIIHAHSPFLLGRLAAAICKKGKIPMVFTHHTLYSEYVHYFKWLPRPVTKHLVNRHVVNYCRRAAVVIAPTLAISNLLVSLGVKQPVEVLETGVDLRELRNHKAIDIRAKFGVGPRDTLLLFVGRLGKEKNLPALLAAVSPILRERSSVKVMLAGDGPQKRELERLALVLGIAGQTIFAGTLGRAAVVSAYKAADVFVFSSLTETQGLVVSEALSVGLPVVAIRAFGVEQMVRHGVDGLLTHPSPQELGRGIQRLLDEPRLAEKFSKNGAALAESRSAEQKTRQLRQIYSRLS